jgi:hypothetical protein
MLDVGFSSALKAMLLLGYAEEEGSPVLSSTQLARSLKTNPSLVRNRTRARSNSTFAVSSQRSSWQSRSRWGERSAWRGRRLTVAPYRLVAECEEGKS